MLDRETEDNWEGLWILQDLLDEGLRSRIPVVISSGFAKTNAPLVGQAYKRFGVLDVWYKSNIDSYPSDFLEVLAGEHYFGLQCEITFEGGLDWQAIVRGLGDRFRWASSAIDFDDAELELRHILRKLFFNYAQVRFAPLSPGMGGAAVLIAAPIQGDGAECAKTVVKYGDAKKIKAEEDNFEAIKGFMQGNRSTQILGAAAGLHLGAISYSFLGSSDGTIKTFAEYYPTASGQDINYVLADLFRETCGLWYKKANRSQLRETSIEEAYSKYCGFNHSNIRDQFEFKYRERPLGQPIIVSALSTSFEHPIDQFMNGAFSFPLELIGCRTHGDLHPNNIFVDQNTRVTWLIDFGATGLGHWARDFVRLEASLVVLHTPSHPITRAFEFLDAWLRLPDLNESIRFNDSAYPEMVKAASCISHMRGLTAKALEDSGLAPNMLLLQYSTALFFQLLNYTRLHRLIRDSNRKNYVLIALCLLSQRIIALKTILGVS
jgi:hypothetical protein